MLGSTWKASCIVARANSGEAFAVRTREDFGQRVLMHSFSSVKVGHLDGWHKSWAGQKERERGQLHLLKSSRVDISAFQPSQLTSPIRSLHKNYVLHHTHTDSFQL